MNINIELDEKYVASLLDMFDYTTEKVLVWYNKLDDDCYNVEDLGSYWKTIAYPKYHRPDVLDKEKVMFDDVKDMGIVEVVNRLFNGLLMNRLFKY
jgi:hypothetical protein